MELTAYEAEAEIEQSHWWFVVRRELFSRVFRRCRLRNDAPVLDIGTGTGANLRLLRDLDHRDVVGLDFSDSAIMHCAAKGLGTVRKGDICNLPFTDRAFQFVFATDVIEHVADDARAMGEIARVLAPGGRVLVTVPAFPSLWGFQDEVAQHLRRYRMQPLLNLIRNAGLDPITYFHFNFVLFAPIWLARQIIRIVKPQIESEGQVNSPLLNAFLTHVFRWDVALAPHIQSPFGVSILVVAERRSK